MYFFDVPFYKVHTSDVYKNLYKSFDIWWKNYLWMNACMHDLYYTNGEIMVWF